MKFVAEINVMPLKNLLDPQGKAVTNSLANIGFSNIDNVRIGKHITLEIDAENKEQAMEMVNDACNKLLSNPIIEGYDYVVHSME
jgi:phosphoribosylformylglycinamidine synthase PurS subunit